MKHGTRKAATGLMAVLVVLTMFLGADAFGYQVKGTIYGGSNPLPNATVTLVNAATFAATPGATSNSSGVYGVSVDDGTYNMSVTPPAGSGFNPFAVNGITVSGADVTQNVVLMQQAITIGGTIKSSDGTVVQNASVSFTYAGTSTTAKTVNTGTTGSYSAALSPGNYDIRISASKGTSNHVPGSAYFSLNNVPLSADTTKNFTLGIVKVTGRTTDGNGTPVPGVSLAVGSTTASPGSFSTVSLSSETATSDSSGNYTLYLPPYTSYTVSLTPPAGNTSVAPTMVQGQSFTADTARNFALQSAATISGTVTSSDGTIVQNASISFTYAGTSTTAKTVNTGTTGSYSAALSPGNYDIRISVSKGTSNHVPGSAYFYQYNVPLSANATKDFTLSIAKVTGRSTDVNGVPVPGVSLAVASATFSSGPFTVSLSSETATSDSSGNYTLYLPSYSNYSVSLTPPAGNTAVAPTIVKALSFTADTTRDLALQSAVSVSGTVTSSDGTVVQNAYIYFSYAGTSTNAKSVSTGTGGTYAAALSPGNYDIRVSVAKGSVNHVPNSAYFYFYDVPLTADTTKDFNLSIVKVTGRTTDSNGVPISGVSLAVGYNSAGGVYLSSESASSDADGAYTLYLPPNAGYSINISAPAGSGFASQLLSQLSVTENLRQNVILDLPDTKQPVIVSGPSVSAITNTIAVVEWETNEPATATLRYGTVNPPSTAITIATATTSHSRTLTGLVADTTYYVSVSATDASGNGPVNSAIVSFRTLPLADVTPPVILEGPLVTSITQSGASVQWTTNEPSTGTLYYGLTSSPATAKSDTAQAASHQIPLTGLAADTLYYVKVAARDLKNNGPTTSAVVSFRTLAGGDSTPPLIVEGPMAVNISDSGATILWKTDEPATSGVSYNDGIAYGLTADAELSTDHSIRLTGLKPDTTYSYTVSSKDSLGNGPSLSRTCTFKTLPAPDTTPPVIVERSVVVRATQQSAVIFWRTDEPSDSVVTFGKTDALGGREEKAALVTQHTITLTGLEPGTLYYFRVSSTDTFHNGPTVSDIFTFTTDTLTKSVSLTITKGPDVVFVSYDLATIAWETDLPADSVIDYVKAGVQGTQRVSSAKREKTHQLSIGNLTQNTAYTATVSSLSVDGASAKKIISFTTPSAPDPDAPQIIDGPTAIGITDSKASIKWRTDRSGDSRVYYAVQGQPMDNFAGETKYLKEHVVVLTNLHPATTYSYYVQSYDPKGNGPATSSVYTFTTKGVADIVGPDMTTPTVSDITFSQGVVRWGTGEPATTQVVFGLAADQLNNNVATPGLSEAHDIALTNLTGGTTYYLSAISADTTGNPTQSEVISFTTLEPPRYWKVTPAAASYGTVSPAAVQTVLEGETASFTLTPADGRMIGSATGCGGNLSGNTFTTGPVTADCTVTVSFVSDAPTVTLATDLPAPQPVGSSITLTATGSGGTGSYEYAFQVMESALWKTVQDYSSLNAWTWDSSGEAAAAYNLRVLVRNAGSTAASQGSASLTYTLSSLPKAAVTLVASPASSQPPGTPVTFTATGSAGTGSYEYAFQMLQGGAWTTTQPYGSAASWTWDTTGQPLAVYSIRVLIRNAGSTVDYDAAASLGYTLTAPPKPTVQLTATPATPQLAGAAVSFTATGGGGTGSYQYQFRILEGSTWSVAQSYGSSNIFVWDTAGKSAGSYRVEVQIRNAGSTAAVEGTSYIDYTLTLPPKLTVSLAATPASPQVTGTPVSFTATASNGTGSYQYAFQILNGAVWETVQPYGSSDTWAWDTAGKAAGTYSIRTLARNDGSSAEFESTAQLSYVLSPLPKPAVSLSATPASPQAAGTQVTFTATGSGGTGSYEYAFQILDGTWKTAQAYSTSATWTWDTTGLPIASYSVRALIRNQGSGADSEDTASLAYSITAQPKPTVQLAASLPSPQLTGAKITFTATGSGGSGSYQYQFKVFDGGAWQVVQDYSSTATWTWDTAGKTATTYPVNVLIRNAGSTAASEGTAVINYVLTAPPSPSVKLAATPASPQVPGTQVTFTATGSGGSGSYEYAFQIYEGGAWQTLQDYSGVNTWTWDTTGKVYTTYSVRTLIRNAGSTAASQAIASLSYVLSAPPKPTVTLVVSPASPQVAGTQVTLTATGKGGSGSYEYSFEVLEAGAWKSYQGYSSVNTWTWDTTGKPIGTYSIRVAVRNAGSGVAAEGTASASYVISAPPKPTVKLTASPVSPQRTGSQITLTATGSGGTGSLEYAFKMFDAGAWKVVQPYSSTNTWVWDSTGKTATTYSFMVQIRNAGSTAVSEGTASLNFVLSP